VSSRSVSLSPVPTQAPGRALGAPSSPTPFSERVRTPLLRHQTRTRPAETALDDGIIGPHYAASKAGLIGLAHNYARLLAGDGVTANVITPALIDTEVVRSNPAARPDLILSADSEPSTKRRRLYWSWYRTVTSQATRSASMVADTRRNTPYASTTPIDAGRSVTDQSSRYASSTSSSETSAT
jgi:NAD(P)-dependent dehydrogenase (short-subunit alcohol dehydrogenase family)